MGEEKKDEKKKKHVCSVCAKPSDLVICQSCEEKIRGEAFEQKRGVEKAGKTDSGRK
ncbi:MAG: hypothetical protein OEV59_06395 [Deltaproteobacteria bacterium]|nr:hypothetical protein [Deltaproteobacteria bacterium]